MALWYMDKVKQFRAKIEKRNELKRVFMKGDTVLYPKLGRGTIVGLKTLGYQDFYVIQLKHSTARVLVPIDRMTKVGATFIRGPSSGK